MEVEPVGLVADRSVDALVEGLVGHRQLVRDGVLLERVELLGLALDLAFERDLVLAQVGHLLKGGHQDRRELLLGGGLHDELPVGHGVGDAAHDVRARLEVVRRQPRELLEEVEDVLRPRRVTGHVLLELLHDAVGRGTAQGLGARAGCRVLHRLEVVRQLLLRGVGLGQLLLQLAGVATSGELDLLAGVARVDDLARLLGRNLPAEGLDLEQERVEHDDGVVGLVTLGDQGSFEADGADDLLDLRDLVGVDAVLLVDAEGVKQCVAHNDLTICPIVSDGRRNLTDLGTERSPHHPGGCGSVLINHVINTLPHPVGQKGEVVVVE